MTKVTKGQLRSAALRNYVKKRLIALYDKDALYDYATRENFIVSFILGHKDEEDTRVEDTICEALQINKPDNWDNWSVVILDDFIEELETNGNTVHLSGDIFHIFKNN